MSKRRPDGMSSEDAALWAHVARTVTRIEARKRHNRPLLEATADAPPVSRLQRSSAPIPHLHHHERGAPQSPPKQPAPVAIEPRKVKRLARGRDEIDARIDLHGMRQVEAHGALRAFLHRAFHNGCRMVLVITGKGREADADTYAPFDMFQDRDRGVLRRNVPRWLAEPDLRMIVVGHTTAHVRHGGDGAFYVQLRNVEKHRG